MSVRWCIQQHLARSISRAPHPQRLLISAYEAQALGFPLITELTVVQVRVYYNSYKHIINSANLELRGLVHFQPRSIHSILDFCDLKNTEVEFENGFF